MERACAWDHTDRKGVKPEKTKQKERYKKIKPRLRTSITQTEAWIAFWTRQTQRTTAAREHRHNGETTMPGQDEAERT